MGAPSLACQTLFLSFLFIGGPAWSNMRKIIVSHAKFVLHCQQYFALRFICNRVRTTLGRASYGSDRRYLAPVVALPSPLFHFLSKECNTNLACEFDQTIIFRPTTPPIKRKKKGLACKTRGHLHAHCKGVMGAPSCTLQGGGGDTFMHTGRWWWGHLHAHCKGVAGAPSCTLEGGGGDTFMHTARE